MEKTKTKNNTNEQKKCCCKLCCSNLFKRIVSAAILIPLVLGVLFVGFPFVNIFILILGFMFAYEWANMVENKNPALYALIYAANVAIGVLFPIPLIFLSALLISCILIFCKAKEEKNRKYLMLGILYVGVATCSLLWLAQSAGFLAIIWLLTMIWATDIGAYLIGCKLRGPKLAPKISPNKTWSGFVGGILFAILASLAFAWLVNALNDYAFYICVAIAISVLGQIGDLIESLIKRKLGIKDSSQIIPGHGGIFDRLDSLLFVAPILVLINFINMFLL